MDPQSVDGGRHRGPGFRETAGRGRAQEARSAGPGAGVGGSSEIEQQLRGDLAVLAEHAAALRRAADEQDRRVEDEALAAERSAARAVRRERAALDARVSAGTTAMLKVARARAEALAPGLSAADWAFPGWASPEWLGAGATRCLRVGRLAVAPEFTGEPVPAIVPLLDTTGWALEGGIAEVVGPLQAAVLRIVGVVPAAVLRIAVHDPRIDGVFAGFGALRAQSAELMGEPFGSVGELNDALREHARAVARVAERLGAAGYPDLAGFHAATGQHAGDYRVQVLLRYPEGIDEQAQEQLLRLAESGPHRGLSLLVHHDPAVTPATGVRPPDLLDRLTRFRPQERAVTVSVLDDVAVVLDDAPSRALVTAVCEAVAANAARAGGPTVDLRTLLPPPDARWRLRGDDELRAVLGVDGTDPVELAIRSSNPPLPNLLIGGAVGQGKSNLLLVLIHGLAVRYSPDDLQMYLLDFKEGLEFDRLGPAADGTWLPHAAVLGLESDRDFGLAVLDHLVAEFNRRATIFKEAGVTELGRYRERHRGEVMPRILVVIDEFQVLLGGGDEIARAAVDQLETLARKGRAYGIHLVLASQTLSGVQELARSQESIFGQFPHRIALKTTPSESQVLLGQHNTEAARLRFRGEAVVNANFGNVEDNRRIVVALADEAHLAGVRRELWANAREVIPPRVFYGGRPALLRDVPGVRGLGSGDPSEAVHGWLGMPIVVDERPTAALFTEDPGRALVVIGDGTDEALGALGAATVSMAAQHRPGSATFVVADLVSADGSWAERIGRAVRSSGNEVRHVGRAELGAELFRLGDLVTERQATGVVAPRIYLVAAGLHRAARLGVADPDRYVPPVDALREIVAGGALSGVFVLGWWNGMRSCEEQLGYGLAGAQCHLFLRAPQDDVQKVCGPFVRWSARAHRGLYWDGANMERPQTVVPFAPLDDDDIAALSISGDGRR